MIMKRIFSFLLAGLIVLSLPVTALADVATSSNAVLGVKPDEYLLSADEAEIMPLSSLGTVSNTVDLSKVQVIVTYYNTIYDRKETFTPHTNLISNDNSGLYLKGSVPEVYYITRIDFYFPPSALPPPGTYTFSMDYASDLSLPVSKLGIWTDKLISNASTVGKLLFPPFSSSSGDVYVPPYKLNLTNLNSFYPHFVFSVDSVHIVGGIVRFNFTPAAADSSAPSTAGTNTSSQDTQNEISSNTSQIANSMNNISSNIGDMAADMAQANASLNYISDSQKLIIEGIDNVILHISDQLYAFWDQLYNLIHVPTMDMLGQILQAIKDVNIDITVDIGDLKSSINAMSVAIQEKIQGQVANDNKIHQEQLNNDNANHENLVNGYDNAGMNADKEKLDTAISDYEAAEDAALSGAKEHINAFEFKDYFTEITAPLADISFFLGGIFSGLGPLNIAVSFSLTLSIALILIGWYRFKGGG